jgi:hypothetical protein
LRLLHVVWRLLCQPCVLLVCAARAAPRCATLRPPRRRRRCRCIAAAMSAPVPRDQALFRFSVRRGRLRLPQRRCVCRKRVTLTASARAAAAQQICRNCRVPTELVEDHAAGDLICKARLRAAARAGSAQATA